MPIRRGLLLFRTVYTPCILGALIVLLLVAQSLPAGRCSEEPYSPDLHANSRSMVIIDDKSAPPSQHDSAPNSEAIESEEETTEEHFRHRRHPVSVDILPFNALDLSCSSFLHSLLEHSALLGSSNASRAMLGTVVLRC